MDYIKLAKKAKEIFSIYKSYKFQVDNINLLNSSLGYLNNNNYSVMIDNKKYEQMKDFLLLMDKVLEQLNEDEKNIIKLTYIDNIHYSQLPYCQSSYFLKRKLALKHFYELITISNND